MMSFDRNRDFLKAYLWEQWDTMETDQKKNVPHPVPEKPAPQNAELVDLVPAEEFTVGKMSVAEAIGSRRSRRHYSGESINVEQLSYLLWATQGVTGLRREGRSLLRTVPSAGARHPFETYLLVNNVSSLSPGLYRYLGVEHKLCFLRHEPEIIEKFHEASYEQFVDKSAVVFMWTVIPYRTEWRYGALAHKMIAQDSGHMCQNLYLACESLGIGTCALGSYNQAMMDELLGVDGKDEFTIYVGTVGQIE
jgi:SagB-type dehydrogenase family enzyme